MASFLVSTPIIDTNLRMAILSFISIITLIFYIFVKNALSVIRVNTITLYKYTVLEVSHNHVMFKVFSKQLVEKVRELDSRKNQTEKGIMQFSFTFTIIPLAKAKGKHIWVGQCILTFFFLSVSRISASSSGKRYEARTGETWWKSSKLAKLVPDNNLNTAAHYSRVRLCDDFLRRYHWVWRARGRLQSHWGYDNTLEVLTDKYYLFSWLILWICFTETLMSVLKSSKCTIYQLWRWMTSWYIFWYLISLILIS